MNQYNYYLNGIQQIGIGNNDASASHQWYKEILGMKTVIFDDEATAELMLPYTGGMPRKRRAILAMNIAGGGGVEIWQYKERRALGPKRPIRVGDLGINIAKFKCRDIEEFDRYLNSDIKRSPIFDDGEMRHIYMQDPLKNWIEVGEQKDWLYGPKLIGGVNGVVIGVSNIEASISFYQKILKYDKVVYSHQGLINDLTYVSQAQNDSTFKGKTVILTHSEERSGAFSPLLGFSQVQLVEREGFKPFSIFEDRFWGDLGYIHLCFDVNHMDELKKACLEEGHPFQVDSGDFEMGEAAGRFAYVEDPDGTLIEFVETYKVPVMKKWNWYFNLKERKHKPLPRWMLKCMGL